jgi:hypothetical protein
MEDLFKKTHLLQEKENRLDPTRWHLWYCLISFKVPTFIASLPPPFISAFCGLKSTTFFSDMAAGSAYSDAVLDSSHRCIRLLEILHGAPEALISCRIRSYPLTTCPPYAALSYTWGSPEDSHKILCNGHPFAVRINLRSFLQEMRTQKRWKHYWIDAICIDQSNVSERNHQVQMMREVYSQVNWWNLICW